jgi:nicotinamide riboside kinase
MKKPARISVIGPEAAGKTELAHILATQFNGIATEEYARVYFRQRHLAANHVLSLAEMCDVMRGQQRIEAEASGVVFIDAGTVHGPIYAAMQHNAEGIATFDWQHTAPEIMDYAVNGRYDAFIICYPHKALGWQNDGMRSMPDYADRNAFADACTAFVAQHYAEKPCIVVNAATWPARAMQAIDGIRKQTGML